MEDLGRIQGPLDRGDQRKPTRSAVGRTETVLALGSRMEVNVARVFGEDLE